MLTSSPSVRWTERFPLWKLSFPAELLVAAIAAGAAAGLRWLIGAHLPPGFPFLTFFPVVILAAFLFGARTGILTAFGSGLAAWYFFLPPTHSWVLDGPAQFAMLFYAFITATEVALVHWMQRANRSLVAAREANARLAETRELLFRELQHRVSNNLQVVAALLTVQRRQVSDEAARASLDEAARRLAVVGRISRQLYDPAGSGQQLGPFLDTLAGDVIATSGRSDVTHHVNCVEGAQLSSEAAIPLALVVAEAVANAIEHGFAGQQNGRIGISVAHEGKHLRVEVADDGRGLPASFDLELSHSLGLRIATMLARQLGGSFSLGPGVERGAVARLVLPA